jgi:hypothetical protein
MKLSSATELIWCTQKVDRNHPIGRLFYLDDEAMKEIEEIKDRYK